MTTIATKAQLIDALDAEIKRRELSLTAVLVLDSLVEQMVPEGPLKRHPSALNMPLNDLAYMVRRDPRQVRLAVNDLLEAELIGQITVREMDHQGRVVFSQQCFDIAPLFKIFGVFPS